jgi:outer membrane protein OmpA-like peptidoglycan-associated protein
MKARDSLPGLLDTYAQLELESLKRGTVEAARQAVNHAEENDADDYAPKTLAQAKQELKLLVSIIEADRTQRKKADAQAEKTIWLARRANEITELAKRFDHDDWSHESIILWYQNQLLRIRQPLSNQLPFDKANAAVINVLRQDIEGLLNSVKDMRDSQTKAQQRIASLQQQMEAERVRYEKRMQQALADLRSGKEARIAALQKQLNREASKKAEAQRKRQAEQQRFESVRALFSPDQAEVLRKEDDVILRLHGFNFPSGKSTIEAKNFGLLNKIVTAVNTFPNSKVKITGHTDARGDKKSNLELSVERAKNVEAFINTTGGIPVDRLESHGRGEAEPVASNETKKGRAKNRRIEVLIVNEDS